MMHGPINIRFNWTAVITGNKQNEQLITATKANWNSYRRENCDRK